MEQPVFVGKQCLSPQYSNHYYCREQAAFFLSHFLSAVESPVTIYGFYVRFVLHLWFGPGQLQRSLHCAHIQFMFHSSSFASLFRGRQTWYTRIPTHRELYSYVCALLLHLWLLPVARNGDGWIHINAKINDGHFDCVATIWMNWCAAIAFYIIIFYVDVVSVQCACSSADAGDEMCVWDLLPASIYRLAGWSGQFKWSERWENGVSTTIVEFRILFNATIHCECADELVDTRVLTSKIYRKRPTTDQLMTSARELELTVDFDIVVNDIHCLDNNRSFVIYLHVVDSCDVNFN